MSDALTFDWRSTGLSPVLPALITHDEEEAVLVALRGEIGVAYDPASGGYLIGVVRGTGPGAPDETLLAPRFLGPLTRRATPIEAAARACVLASILSEGGEEHDGYERDRWAA